MLISFFGQALPFSMQALDHVHCKCPWAIHINKITQKTSTLFS